MVIFTLNLYYKAWMDYDTNTSGSIAKDILLLSKACL